MKLIICLAFAVHVILFSWNWGLVPLAYVAIILSLLARGELKINLINK